LGWPREWRRGLGKAHVEHFVRFVEHQDFELAEVQRLPAQVVERAAGVATMMLAPRRRARICCSIDAPP
jgi:hypothetical protein